MQHSRPCDRAIFSALALIGCVACSGALADARSAPAVPLVTPRYNQPVNDIEVLQPIKNRGGRAGSADSSPPGVNAATPPASSGAGVGVGVGVGVGDGASACATDLLHRPDLPNTPALTASRELERLRATAKGEATVGLPKQAAARQQRLQASAAWQMGLLTLHGICMVPNAADAQAWFEMARQLGEPLAPAGLAWCEIDGCRAAANPAAAGRWIDQLRGIDAPRALYLQWLLQSKLAPIEVASPNAGGAGKRDAPRQGRQLLLAAARRGDTNAQIELGLASVAENDLPGAIVFFNSAAARSSAAASNSSLVSQRLARIKPQPAAPTPAPVTTTGQGSSLDTAVINLNTQSAGDNLAQARRYHQGAGVPANYSEAIRLYQLAQQQGSADARKMLALIFSRPAANGDLDVTWMLQLAQLDLAGASLSPSVSPYRDNFKRDPSPLFELVPKPWRKFAPAEIRG